jgi:hypothetical protein
MSQQMVSMNQLNAFGSNLVQMFQKTPTQQDEDDNNIVVLESLKTVVLHHQ